MGTIVGFLQKTSTNPLIQPVFGSIYDHLWMIHPWTTSCSGIVHCHGWWSSRDIIHGFFWWFFMILVGTPWLMGPHCHTTPTRVPNVHGKLLGFFWGMGVPSARGGPYESHGRTDLPWQSSDWWLQDEYAWTMVYAGPNAGGRQQSTIRCNNVYKDIYIYSFIYLWISNMLCVYIYMYICICMYIYTYVQPTICGCHGDMMPHHPHLWSN